MEVTKFHWADYLVFGLSLLISVFIGIYFAVTSNRTTKDMLVASRNSGAFPVAMSMLASFISGITIISIPAEIYYNGTMFVYIGFGYVMFGLIGAFIYVPIFHKMNITSAHEYLEIRFNYLIRVIGSLAFITMMVLYMSVVMYAPAIAFSVVTDISENTIIIVLGLVCTFYTMIGGIKAVIWTDTFQMMVIFSGLLTFIVIGTSNIGDIQTVWEKAKNGSRVEFDVFDPDPRVRNTFWSLTFGACFQLLGLAGGNQVLIQRYLCVNKIRDAQIALMTAILGAVFVLSLTTVLGLIINAEYSECDPLLSGTVTKPDQILPMFMMQTLGNFHGLPGMFTASVFAATLSTVSSAINSVAAVALEDLIKPLHTRCVNKQLTERQATWITRILSLLFGLVTIGMSYLAPQMGDLIIQISLSIFGTAGGPLCGLFSLGIFFPFVNSFGAAMGILASIGVTYWINIEAIFLKKPGIPKPLSIDGCVSHISNVTNTTLQMTTQVTYTNAMDVSTIINDANPVGSDGLGELFSISYLWYGLVSLIVAIVVGVLTSLLTCGRHGKAPIRRDLRYLTGDECCCCCFAKFRNIMNCGYAEDVADKEYDQRPVKGNVNNLAFLQNEEKY